MKLFGQLIRTAINTTLLPVAVVKDVLTLGNLASGDDTYTKKQVEKLKEEAEEK